MYLIGYHISNRDSSTQYLNVCETWDSSHYFLIIHSFVRILSLTIVKNYIV